MATALVIITGTKKEVFCNSQVFRELMNENKCSKITIITNRENMNLFRDIIGFENELYILNAESYLILVDKYFDFVIDLSKEELGKSLAKKFLSIKKNYQMVEDYYFEKPAHPYDFIHQAIRSNGKYLIGINIGENEHISKKLPILSITSLINKLNNLISAKFVLFGTPQNNIRFDSIKRKTQSDLINMVGLTNPKQLAQAIGLCDIFVSPDGFLMHLSLAIKQNTIGLFAKKSLLKVKNRNLIKIKSSYELKKECLENCNNESQECPILFSIEDGENCFYHFDEKEIIRSITNLLLGDES